MRRAPLLIVAGVVALLVGLALWNRASDQQEEDRVAAGFERAVLLDAGEEEQAALVDADPDAERTLPIVVLLLAGVLVVSGVVLLREQT